MATALPLVWPNGQPMRPAALKQEIAAPTTMGVRSIVSGHPAQGLTPQRLASLLRAAEDGDAIGYLELAEEMEEKDLHYQSVMGTRKRQVTQLPIEVVPAGDSKEEKADAQLIRDWLDRDVLEAELFDIMDAVGKGYSATEIVWEFTDTAWLPAKLKRRDPRFFEFDRVDGETLLLRDIGPSQPLPAAKFVVHYHQAKSGIPIRGGIARAVAWGYMFKNFAIKDWVAFLETYGMPMRVGRYANGETEENIQKLLDALADLGSDAAAAFPESMKVEFIDGKAGTAPNDLWRSKAEYVDSQVSKAVLGQTGTTDSKQGGMGDGGNKVHNDVRGDIERADAKQLAATLNEQLVMPMVMLNRGPRRRYPRIRIGRPEAVDVKGLIEAATALVPLGVEIGADDVRDRAGFSAPEAGVRLLTVSATAPATPVERQNGSIPPDVRPPAFLGPLRGGKPADQPVADALASATAAEAAANADAVDVASEEALADWEAVIAPVLDPVRALVATSAGFDDLRARLASAVADMDVTALTELLARSAFGARLAGDVSGRPTE